MSFNGLLKTLKPSGIRAQLILGIAILIVVLMSLFVIELMNRQKTFFLKLNNDRAMGLSVNLASTANSYVISYELARLQKLVSTYKQIPGLEYAIITSDDGVVLAHTNEKYLGLKATDSISLKLKHANTTQILIENNDLLDIATPIINHNEVVGWARVGISQKYIEPNITAIKHQGFIYILISLILGSVFAVIVAGRLSKGLEKLVTVAQNIKAGNRDLRASPSKSTEVTQLGTAINQMLDDISSNEKLLGMVLENLPVGVWILDDKGKILSVNAAGEEMWKGVKYVGVEDYNEYKAWFTETGKEVQNNEWGAAIVLVEGRSVLNQEIEIECFDKSRKIILNSAIPLRDPQGKITGVITINVDITVRKKSEEGIKERESLLSSLFDNMEGSLALFDTSKKITLFNRRFADNHKLLTNKDPKVGDGAHDFLSEEMMKEPSRLMDSALKGNKEVFEKDYLSNGNFVSFRTSYNPIVNDGKVTGITSYSIDLSKSREAERKVHENEEKFRMSFMTSQDAFYIGTLNEGIIIDVNESFCNLFGYSKEESIGKTTLELNLYVRPEDRTKMVDGIKANGSLKDLELRSRKKNGEEILISITVNVWEMNNEKVLMAVIRDITERKRAEEKLRENEERYKSIISVSNTGAWEYHGDSEYLWCSPEYFSMLGRKQSDYNISGSKNLKETWIDLLHPDDVERAATHFSEYLKNGSVGTYESNFRMLHANGNWLWIWSRGQTIRDANGNITSLTIGTHIDITEQRKTSEMFMHQFENSPDIILVVNRDLTIESINKSRPEGPSVQELIGKSCIEVLPEESREASKKAVISCFETGEKHDMENLLYANRWVRSRFVPITIDGIITHVMIIATEITEQKRAVQNLKQSEEKNRALIENISDTIILLDENIELVYVSPSFIRTAGFSLEDHEGKHTLEFIHPDDVDKCRTIFAQAMSTPGASIQDQVRLLHKNGDYIWVEGTVTNMLQNESVKAMVVNYRNITERKRFEEQQLLISSIVNSSDDAIISKSLDGKITSWNHGAELVLGYSSNETIGKPISMIIPQDLMNEEAEIIEKIKTGASVDHFETQRRKKNGELIYASITVSPIFDSLGNVIGASKILRDITEQKAMELERVKTINELIQKNRDLEQFSFIVSHNIRSPLATILGLANMLKYELPQKEQLKIMKGMQKWAYKLDNVIKDVNDILNSKKELMQSKTKVDFNVLLKSVTGDIMTLIKQNGAKIDHDFSAVKAIDSIPSYQHSIFLNLISNSIKYAKHDVPAEIKIWSERRDGKVVLHFKDNGIGIDMKKHKDEIFGLYKKFDFKMEGKGMGLFMVKTQVNALNGTIEILSELEKGTEFTITLPV